MCSTHDQESADHLFTACVTARALTNQVLGNLPPHDTVPNAWTASCRRLKQETWTTVAWTLWQERNKRIFQGQQSNIGALAIKASSYITQWALYRSVPKQQPNVTQVRVEIREL
jgi:hypothetical protein